jgi:flagellar motor protein MotB
MVNPVSRSMAAGTPYAHNVEEWSVMIRRSWFAFLGLCVAASIGCTGQIKELQKQNAGLRDQLQAGETERSSLETQLNALKADRAALDKDLTDTRNKSRQLQLVVDQLKAEQAKLDQQKQDLMNIVKGFGPILGVKSTGEGNFFVLESDILFDSGKVDIKDDAKKALDKVAEYLNDHPDQMIRVDGHTDGVPIHVSQWKDNYHLAAMRALSVMQYLQQKGVSPERMSIAGFGPNKPAVVPDTRRDLPGSDRRPEHQRDPAELPALRAPGAACAASVLRAGRYVCRRAPSPL